MSIYAWAAGVLAIVALVAGAFFVGQRWDATDDKQSEIDTLERINEVDSNPTRSQRVERLCGWLGVGACDLQRLQSEQDSVGQGPDRAAD